MFQVVMVKGLATSQQRVKEKLGHHVLFQVIMLKGLAMSQQRMKEKLVVMRSQIVRKVMKVLLAG